MGFQDKGLGSYILNVCRRKKLKSALPPLAEPSKSSVVSTNQLIKRAVKLPPISVAVPKKSKNVGERSCFT